MPVLNLNKLNVTNITVSDEMGQLRNGLKTAFALHRGDKIITQTPEMKMPFKLDANVETPGRYAVCLNVPADGVFGGRMRDIDRLIKTLAKERSQEWFKKPTISEESLDMNYTPIIRSGGEYQDKFKCKIDRDTKFFDASRTPSDVSIVTQGCSLRAIVELRYIWMNNGKFGATWVARQIQVMHSESEDDIDFVDSESDSDDSN